MSRARHVRFAEASLRGIWFAVVPGELTALTFRYLIPAPLASDGILRIIASAGNQYPLLLGFSLFFLFGWLARSWIPLALADRDTTSNRKREALFVAASAVVAAISAIALRAWFFESYEVLHTSMLPTLESGDRVLASKFGRAPHRGDLVVFLNETGEGPPHLVKRVIGLPGDRVTMRGDHPVIHGWEVPSCDAGTYVYPLVGGSLVARLVVEFLDDDAYLTVQQGMGPVLREPYQVKPGELFVLGDNRSNSRDSREGNGGRGKGIPLSHVAGRAAWLLSSTQRDGRVDFTEILRPLVRRLRVQGVDTRSLEQGVLQCLRQWPQATRPPETEGTSSMRESSAAGDPREPRL